MSRSRKGNGVRKCLIAESVSGQKRSWGRKCLGAEKVSGQKVSLGRKGLEADNVQGRKSQGTQVSQGSKCLFALGQKKSQGRKCFAADNVSELYLFGLNMKHTLSLL